jgi:hypothetical protein
MLSEQLLQADRTHWSERTVSEVVDACARAITKAAALRRQYLIVSITVATLACRRLSSFDGREGAGERSHA